ncbi:MAG: hypothetical protein V9F00_15860 [Nocardioides sp.]
MTIKNLWTTMTTELSDARADRAMRRQLREELSTYRTEAEIWDLLAAIDHSESREADQVRLILEQNLTNLRRPLALAS